MKQPNATIDLSQQLDEFKNTQIAIPRLHHWELIEDDSDAAYPVPTADVFQVSLESAFRIGDRLPAIHGVSLFSLSYTMLELFAVMIDRKLDSVMRTVEDGDTSLSNLERALDLSQSVSNHLIFGFSSEGLSSIRDEVANVRKVIDPWFEKLSDESVSLPQAKGLRDSVNRLEGALEQIGKIVAAQALLSSAYNSRSHIQQSMAQKLQGVLEHIEEPIESICSTYSEIMGQIVTIMCASIEEDTDHDMYEQERMVRMFVDPIEDARPLLLTLGDTVKDQLSRLRAEITRRLS